MAKGTRICKICGKEYEYCYTNYVAPGVFRWQDVACCEEHGQEYLRKIMVSRGEIKAESEEPKRAKAKKSFKATAPAVEKTEEKVPEVTDKTKD